MHAQKSRKNDLSSHICFYAGQPEGAGSFLYGPAEDAPRDKDTEHGTNGVLSNPSCSSFASKVPIAKKCQEVTEAKTARDGSNQKGTELSAVSCVGPTSLV